MCTQVSPVVPAFDVEICQFHFRDVNSNQGGAGGEAVNTEASRREGARGF